MNLPNKANEPRQLKIKILLNLTNFLDKTVAKEN